MTNTTQGLELWVLFSTSLLLRTSLTKITGAVPAWNVLSSGPTADWFSRHATEAHSHDRQHSIWSGWCLAMFLRKVTYYYNTKNSSLQAKLISFKATHTWTATDNYQSFIVYELYKWRNESLTSPVYLHKKRYGPFVVCYTGKCEVWCTSNDCTMWEPFQVIPSAQPFP